MLANNCEKPTKGIFVCHTCDNRKCVNPDHLFLGDIVINTLDMNAKGRNARGSMCPIAKLNEEKVAEIRRLNATGNYTKIGLARTYGVSFTTINNLIKRKSWKHVL
jgi:hypothetical protein